MVDTGATHTLITRSFLGTLPRLPICHSSTPAAFLCDASSTIVIHGVVRLCIYVNHAPTFVMAHIVDSLHTDVILGMDWCTRYDVRLCVRDQSVQLHHPSHGFIVVPFLQDSTVPTRLAQSITLLPYHEHIVRLRSPLSSAANVSYTPPASFCRIRNLVIPDAVLKIKNFHTYLLLYNPNATTYTLKKDLYLGDLSYISNSSVAVSDLATSPAWLPPSLHNIHLSSAPTVSSSSSCSPALHDTLTNLVSHLSDPPAKTAFLNILHRHARVFDTSCHTIAKTSIPHAIVTGDHPPISVRPYYRTVSQRKDLQHEVDKLLFDNIIRPSTSPWSSPVLLKKKPDGTFRFLVDFRRLNSVTKKDSYPQPSAEELLQRLAGHHYFTKLDLKSGYFQIPINGADKEKTAFVTPDGHYEFNVLAQGLMNAPATFQRVMNNLIATGRWDYVVVYLDDIVIFSRSLADHQRHVDEILSILARAHFKVSPPKCAISSQRIEFLGHFITSSTVEPSPDKVRVILDMQPPRTLSQANRFLGKIGYYLKFIPDFARLAAPLHKVSNKTRTRRHEFYWRAEQQQAFDTFKQILTSTPYFCISLIHRFLSFSPPTPVSRGLLGCSSRTRRVAWRCVVISRVCSMMSNSATLLRNVRLSLSTGVSNSYVLWLVPPQSLLKRIINRSLICTSNLHFIIGASITGFWNSRTSFHKFSLSSIAKAPIMSVLTRHAPIPKPLVSILLVLVQYWCRDSIGIDSFGIEVLVLVQYWWYWFWFWSGIGGIGFDFVRYWYWFWGIGEKSASQTQSI